jgi:hypothetical protein
MGEIKTIVEAVETKLAALGFTATEEVFDFDAVPSSVIHKAFRIETRVLENRYNLDGQTNPKEEIAVWIAYKTYRSPRAAQKTALDDRETIEAAVVNDPVLLALDSDPILAMDGEASREKLVSDVLVSRISFTADYIRQI